MQFTQIKETCLYVRDLDRTAAFYAGKLGLKQLVREEGRHVFFRAGSSVLLCFIPTETRKENKLPSHGGEGELHFALEIPSGTYEDCRKEIESKGIMIEHEQDWKHGRRSCYFRDPDRHLVEIIEAGAWK